MTKLLILISVLSALLLAARSTAEELTPLGTGLEDLAYPYAVRFIEMDLQGQRVRMAYMDVKPEGIANAPAVVLLHGKNFWGAYWADTISALSKAGYRVIVPDQIGFGKSSKADIDYSFDLLAANTAKLLDFLEIRQASIVGHSMGGMLAVRFARNYPDRTSQLILENPIGLEDYRNAGVPSRPFEEVYRDELEKTPESLQGYIKTYFPTWNEKWAIFGIVPSRVRLSGEWPRWAKASALTYQMIYQQPVRHEFSLIKAPTFLIIGQSDRTAVGKNLAAADAAKAMGNYPELGRQAVRDIPGAQLKELPGVGHIPHLQVADEFNALLLDFLRKQPAT